MATVSEIKLIIDTTLVLSQKVEKVCQPKFAESTIQTTQEQPELGYLEICIIDFRLQQKS